jgi:hypothetical protein
MTATSRQTARIVLSASRRTDIPAFYLSWFLRRIDQGYFDVANPYNQTVRRIPADPASVHTIVFWSKNFGRFLAEHAGEYLQKKGYHLFFNHTLNSELPLLEPRVPPLDMRLQQLAELSRRFGPQSISWRFDPVCFFRLANAPMQTNLSDFGRIAKRAADAGIRRCITSFMDHYSKITRRLAARPGLEFLDPLPDRKVETLLWMRSILRPMEMTLHTCCEKDITERLPKGSDIQESACIPNSLLKELYGGHISLRHDPGQRRRMGCRCQVSVDIGSYRDHYCDHGCLYCYASPSHTASAI